MAVISPAWGVPGFEVNRDLDTGPQEAATPSRPASPPIRVLLVIDYGFVYATARAAFGQEGRGVFHVAPASVARMVVKGQRQGERRSQRVLAGVEVISRPPRSPMENRRRGQWAQTGARIADIPEPPPDEPGRNRRWRSVIASYLVTEALASHRVDRVALFAGGRDLIPLLREPQIASGLELVTWVDDDGRTINHLLEEPSTAGQWVHRLGRQSFDRVVEPPLNAWVRQRRGSSRGRASDQAPDQASHRRSPLERMLPRWMRRPQEEAE